MATPTCIRCPSWATVTAKTRNGGDDDEDGDDEDGDDEDGGSAVAAACPRPCL